MRGKLNSNKESFGAAKDPAVRAMFALSEETKGHPAMPPRVIKTGQGSRPSTNYQAQDF